MRMTVLNRPVCRIEDCGDITQLRQGVCERHYSQWLRRGSPVNFMGVVMQPRQGFTPAERATLEVVLLHSPMKLSTADVSEATGYGLKTTRLATMNLFHRGLLRREGGRGCRGVFVWIPDEDEE